MVTPSHPTGWAGQKNVNNMLAPESLSALRVPHLATRLIVHCQNVIYHVPYSQDLMDFRFEMRDPSFVVHPLLCIHYLHFSNRRKGKFLRGTVF